MPQVRRSDRSGAIRSLRFSPYANGVPRIGTAHVSAGSSSRSPVYVPLEADHPYFSGSVWDFESPANGMTAGTMDLGASGKVSKGSVETTVKNGIPSTVHCVYTDVDKMVTRLSALANFFHPSEDVVVRYYNTRDPNNISHMVTETKQTVLKAFNETNGFEFTDGENLNTRSLTKLRKRKPEELIVFFPGFVKDRGILHFLVTCTWKSKGGCITDDEMMKTVFFMRHSWLCWINITQLIPIHFPNREQQIARRLTNLLTLECSICMEQFHHVPQDPSICAGMHGLRHAWTADAMCFSCENCANVFCRTCYWKLRQCPQCKRPFKGTFIRKISIFKEEQHASRKDVMQKLGIKAIAFKSTGSSTGVGEEEGTEDRHRRIFKDGRDDIETGFSGSDSDESQVNLLASVSCISYCICHYN